MFLSKSNNGAARSKGAVVITGASTGIGKAAALMLDRRGFHIFAGVRKVQDGEALQAEASDKLVPILLDVTNSEQISAAAQKVEAALAATPSIGGLIGLVNNAGIAVAGPSEFVPLSDFRFQFDVNVFGVIEVTQAFLGMLRPTQGRVVNVSSIAGRFASPFLGPYTASKHALEALSDSLRLEIRPWGMHVSLVEPGAVKTPIWEKSLKAALSLEARMPEAVNTLYGPALKAIKKAVENPSGISAETVAQSISHALTSSKPKTRYLLGRDAKMMARIGKLPTALRDRLVASQLPKYGK